MLCPERFDLKTDQAVETHLENRCCLTLGKTKKRSHLFRDFGLEGDVVRHTVYKTFPRVFH